MERNGHVPKWWRKELSFIDPRYRVIWNKHYRYYNVQYFNRHPLVRRWTNIAVYRYLNDQALDDMRKRKRMGLKCKGDLNQHMKWIKEQEREAKRKEGEIAQEMMTEGYMKMHEVGRKKSFNIGG